MSSQLKPIICPSVLASDLSSLASDAKRMVDAGCDWLHLDIMDGYARRSSVNSPFLDFLASGASPEEGKSFTVVLQSRLFFPCQKHFVPNISFGPGVVKALRGHLKSAFFDVHLMVSEPEKWIQPFADAGANSITFHWESVGGDLQRAAELAKRIQARGIKAGLAIKPATKFEDLGEALAGDNFDMLLVMTVEPGFGGQKFMADMLQKVRTARSLFPKLNIQVDGGLDGETVKPAASAGANVIVAGTSMFKAENPAALMTFMRDVIAASDTL